MNFCKDCVRKQVCETNLVTGESTTTNIKGAYTERATNEPAYCGEVGKFFQPKRKNALEHFANVLSNSVHKTLSFLRDK